MGRVCSSYIISFSFRAYREKNLRRRQILLHGIVRLIGTAFIISTASIIGFNWPQLAPSPQELVQTVWIALLVAVIAVLGRKALIPHRAYFDEKIDLVVQDIGIEMWEEIRSISLEHGVEPAIVATEVLQRPRWTRKLERILGRFLPNTSFGIAQVRAERPISDRESVERLAQEIGQIPLTWHMHDHDVFEDYREFVASRQATPGYDHEVESFYIQLFDPGDRPRFYASDEDDVDEKGTRPMRLKLKMSLLLLRLSVLLAK